MSLDLELQSLKCPALAVAGLNGKSTTASLIERMLLHNGRKTMVCGRDAQPISSVPDGGVNLDFLIVQIDPGDLSPDSTFRPTSSVLLNLGSAFLEEDKLIEKTIEQYAPLFRDQQFFDWAIVQSEALARLRAAGVSLPAKTISFSATDQTADLFLDRGLLLSRLPNWPGPLLDLDHCLLRGPHNAENLMAALAIGHGLRLPLEGMIDALKTFRPGPDRCELVAEINGVQFVNDSRAANVEATQSALRTVRLGENGEPNVWLIAGGEDCGQDFHALGPLLSKRVKRAFLFGEASLKIRSAWSLFTPCMLSASLLEAVAEAAKSAASGDVVLLSPACSGLDRFRNYQSRGQVFCEVVKSIGRGQLAPRPHISGVPAPAWS